jgi:hypothetical protein
MTGQDVVNAIGELELLLNGAATAAETILPTEEVPIEAVAGLANYFLKMAGIAITAFEGASGTEITPETIDALKADRTPLVPPTS